MTWAPRYGDMWIVASGASLVCALVPGDPSDG